MQRVWQHILKSRGQIGTPSRKFYQRVKFGGLWFDFQFAESAKEANSFNGATVRILGEVNNMPEHWVAALTNDAGVINILGKGIKWDLSGLGLVYVLSVIEKVFKLFKAFADYVSASGTKIIALLPDCGAPLAVAAYVAAAGSLVVTSQQTEPIPSLGRLRA